MSRKNCCRKSECDCGCKPDKKKCKSKKTSRFIPQANMKLTDAIQVPDLNTFITGCVGCTGCATDSFEALEEYTGVPVVRFKAGESKEDIARPLQDEAAAAGRPGLVLVGKAQERTLVWRGYVDDTHAGHRPTHPHMAWRRQPRARPLVLLFLRRRVGTGLPQDLYLRRRSRCGPAPTATNGPSANWPRRASASRLSTTDCAALRTPPPRTASVPVSALVICAGFWPA